MIYLMVSCNSFEFGALLVEGWLCRSNQYTFYFVKRALPCAAHALSRSIPPG